MVNHLLIATPQVFFTMKNCVAGLRAIIIVYANWRVEVKQFLDAQCYPVIGLANILTTVNKKGLLKSNSFFKIKYVMRAYKRIYLCVLLLLSVTFTVSAQQNGTINLFDKVKWYGSKNSSPVLFIHFDKTVYSNTEVAWFTSYLLNAKNVQSYNTLSVALIKDDDRSVILDNKFNIKGGVALGNITIPNAALPGNYSFVATTNRLKNGRPEVVFTQPITIKSEEPDDFTASLSALDTSLSLPLQKIRLSTSFKNLKAGEVIPSLTLSYYLGSSVQPIISGYGQTKEGSYDFAIPTSILKQGNNVLHVQLWYKNEIKEISMQLPAYKQPALVNFYPEGGNLVNNLPNVIGVEIKTADNDPIRAAATLYENEKPIVQFQTGDYGIDRFTFVPKANNSYMVKLTNLIQKDTAYILPKAISAGPVINVEQALANDTLYVQLHHTKPEKLFLQVHNFKKLFFSVPVIANKSKRLKILLDSIPKGLTQLTLTDSLGRPFAERLFFAHYNKRTPVEIKTDNSTYGTRQKVTVKIKLTVAITDTALVSIACVQGNRVEIKKQNDIESYLYLKNDLGEIPLRERYFGNEEADKEYLEAVLLVKGWRRYTWTDVLKTTETDATNKYTDAIIKGKVVQFDNTPVRKPVTLLNLRYLNTITTNKQGMFELNNNNLRADSGKKAAFIVLEPRPDLYNIRVNNPYDVINERFAVQLQPKEYFFKGQESTQYMELPDNEHAIHLKEVTIKGTNDNVGTFNRRLLDRNGWTIFYVGEYRYDREGNISTLPYNTYGTTEPTSSYKLQLNGIYQAREFYPANFVKDPSQGGMLSTLYWKHLTALLPGKEKEISFYTGDITGRFKIVVQGISVNDVVYSETDFTVTKPK